MAVKILVAYGTKYGGTAEIAEKIGEVLRGEDLQADVTPANSAGDPAQYDAFVVGSAVYIGMWRKEAVNFVLKNEKQITGKPVWLFSSGPTGEGDPVELMQGWRFPKKLGPAIDRIQPRDIAIFGGVADTQKFNFLENFVLKIVKSPAGDFRDWDAITTWAKNIAAELKK